MNPLRAVLEDPADDHARLVYADWLEEHGERPARDRAKFIRAQVSLAQMPNTKCKIDYRTTGFASYRKRCRCEVCKLRMAEYYSACRHMSTTWFAEINQPIMDAWQKTVVAAGVGNECPPLLLVHGDFARGFVYAIKLPVAVFQEQAARIFGLTPVERVTLTDRRPFETYNGRWAWTLWTTAMPDESRIPDVLDIGAHGPFTRLSAGDFPTQDTATAALSERCVAYGRVAAGLPALAHHRPEFRIFTA